MESAPKGRPEDDFSISNAEADGCREAQPDETASRISVGTKNVFSLPASDRTAMQFIEMTGQTLLRIVGRDGDEPTPEELEGVGVADGSIIRVNRQGDIEIRRRKNWDLVGGLLGDFETRIRDETGLEWIEE